MEWISYTRTSRPGRGQGPGLIPPVVMTKDRMCPDFSRFFQICRICRSRYYRYRPDPSRFVVRGCRYQIQNGGCRQVWSPPSGTTKDQNRQNPDGTVQTQTEPSKTIQIHPDPSRSVQIQQRSKIVLVQGQICPDLFGFVRIFPGFFPDPSRIFPRFAVSKYRFSRIRP